jgi:hypothetical protein
MPEDGDHFVESGYQFGAANLLIRRGGDGFQARTRNIQSWRDFICAIARPVACAILDRD